MVGGNRAHAFEKGAAILQCLDKGSVVMHRHATQLAQRINIFVPIGCIQIDHAVWAKCRQDFTLPTRSPDRPVLFEWVGGGIGGAEHLYVETLEQAAWAEFG